ncbi:hypothetical protein EI555_009034 [Monodon monoceros]|uniref:Uncharacterized protein n=1 Tax=Monodon monoceros TaxID=40151 RepID=A0A4U1F400_MONMO|nr:hypothetical protein EI555_009034 [Monodon monoceros]
MHELKNIFGVQLVALKAQEWTERMENIWGILNTLKTQQEPMIIIIIIPWTTSTTSQPTVTTRSTELTATTT